MSKAKLGGMRFHQGLSFSPLFFRVAKARAVFWPGCAIMSLGPDLLDKTYQVLLREDPDLGLSSACCGQPTRFLFPDKQGQRRTQIVNKLKKQGVHTIYTTCANCELELAFLEDIEVISAWPILAKHLREQDLSPVQGDYVLHDPCPLRKRSDIHDALRQLLDLAQVTYVDPEQSREKTTCCGNKGMLNILEPEKSAKVKAIRLANLDEAKTITSSCQGCLGTFSVAGRDTRHLLEILFGHNDHKGWGERLRYSLQVSQR